MHQQKKECFIHMEKNLAFELINGKATKLEVQKILIKDEIKFVSYSKN